MSVAEILSVAVRLCDADTELETDPIADFENEVDNDNELEIVDCCDWLRVMLWHALCDSDADCWDVAVCWLKEYVRLLLLDCDCDVVADCVCVVDALNESDRLPLLDNDLDSVLVNDTL